MEFNQELYDFRLRCSQLEKGDIVKVANRYNSLETEALFEVDEIYLIEDGDGYALLGVNVKVKNSSGTAFVFEAESLETIYSKRTVDGRPHIRKCRYVPEEG